MIGLVIRRGIWDLMTREAKDNILAYYRNRPIYCNGMTGPTWTQEECPRIDLVCNIGQEKLHVENCCYFCHMRVSCNGYKCNKRSDNDGRLLDLVHPIPYICPLWIFPMEVLEIANNRVKGNEIPRRREEDIKRLLNEFDGIASDDR